MLLNMKFFHVFEVICVLYVLSCLSIASEIRKFPFLMPNVNPNKPELYLCTPVKVLPDKSYYIVGFEPNATMDTAHHMLLYGCSKPGSNELVWDCGEMVSDSNNPEKKHSPCEENSQVIYAWARDAPTLRLPHDVGFQVGKGSQIKYMVLQVHYANVEKFKALDGNTSKVLDKKAIYFITNNTVFLLLDGSTDNSGISLYYTQTPKKKQAGVLLLGTGGLIPPGKITNMETDCRIEENKIIYPFAYRTHTHSLGIVVSGYRVRYENGVDQWTLLGKRNPLTPQMFYPVNNTDPITHGDILAARCTMESNRLTITHIGATNKDEMCNFYLMYYVEKGTPLDMKYCFSPGPPYYSWKLKNEFHNIPDKAASSLS